MADSYQLVIIGGGPGGYVAAIRAAQLGIKTAVVEKKTLGGTCLNVGCIPSKALLASSEHFHNATHTFAAHGIIAKDVSVDLPALMKRKDTVVSTLSKGVGFLLKKNKVDVIEGIGTLKDAHTVTVDNNGKKQDVQAEKILLATGSVSVELPFMKFDGKRIVSSDQAIALPEIPKKLLVIGAGAIGLELGTVWSRLGSKVQVVEFLPRIAPGFDLEIANALQRSLTKQGIEFHLSTKVKSAEVKKDKVIITTEQDGKELSFDADIVLVAVGRKPYTEGLGLDKVGVKLNEKGKVVTDGHWQTSAPSIYAIGDLTSGPMLAHKAEDEGVALAECLAGKSGHVNYNVIPGIVYTSPEASGVGMTEEEAKKIGVSYKVGKFSLMSLGRALAGGVNEGLVKIIADERTDKVLGAHILGAHASELIAECVTLMEFGGSAEDLARTVHAHPTMSEGIKEAALAVDKRAIHA